MMDVSALVDPGLALSRPFTQQKKHTDWASLQKAWVIVACPF